jgi:hypothetical protein
MPRAAFRATFALCAILVLSACARIDPGIRRIDRMVAQLREKQEAMLAAAFPVDGWFSYPEGTEIIARSDSSGVRMIELTALAGMGKTEEDFFFRDGELVYCERRIRRDERPGGEMSRRESTGYYFRDDRITGAIDPDSGKRRKPSVQLSAEGPPIIERAYYFLRIASSGYWTP